VRGPPGTRTPRARWRYRPLCARARTVAAQTNPRDLATYTVAEITTPDRGSAPADHGSKNPAQSIDNGLVKGPNQVLDQFVCLVY